MPQPPNIKGFLNKIEQIESSGGQDTDHPKVQSGIHAGMSAIGRYGLMPNTVKELINRRKINGSMTTDLQDLDNSTPEEMKSKIEGDPDLENELANQLANIVTRKQMGDEDKAAYAWQNGHNLAPEQITPDKLQQSSYVKKFQQLGGMMNKFQDPTAHYKSNDDANVVPSDDEFDKD